MLTLKWQFIEYGIVLMFFYPRWPLGPSTICVRRPCPRDNYAVMDNLPNGQRLGRHYYRLLPKFKGTAFGPFIISNLVIWTSFGHPD